MKKLSVFIAAIVCSLVFAIGAKAADPADFFVGKWKVTTNMTSGDVISYITFERKDGKMTGLLVDDQGKLNTFTKIQEKDNTITSYFNAGGYNVYIFLEKIDENNLSGSMVDMFDCTATRVIEKK